MRSAVLVALAACASHAGSSSEPPRDVIQVTAPVAAPAAPAAPAADLADLAPPAEPPAEPGCVDGAPYDAAALRDRVAYLASTELDGRATGTAGDAAARAYIAARFRCLGLVPGGDDASYEQPFTARGRATANLVGYVPGEGPTAGDVIVVGAHHDHLGDGHLGANDNASGVVALLAIAQAVRQRGAPHRTIAFVAFGGEELGLHGSAHFAAHPPAALPLDRFVYDINLDMVGSYRSTGAVQAMGTFRNLPATAIVEALRREHALRVGTGGRGVGSDHEAFCRAGIPYVFFWTPDRRCYHARCDTTAQLDAAHLADIAAFAGALVERLADSPLDLAASRERRGCTGRG